jgi:hypothetical protein
VTILGLQLSAMLNPRALPSGRLDGLSGALISS